MNDDDRPYHVEIDGLEDGRGEVAPGRRVRGRPWLGIHFECCGAYTRVYRNRTGTAYTGYCPRCAKRVHIPIGGGGTDARFFTAT